MKENKSLEKDKDKVENPVKKATLLDLSGGGMKIRAKENLKKGDILLVNINYNDIKLDLKGRVVRVKEENDNYLCGVSFLNIDNKTREKIIKIVFIILRRQSELV
nr:PilZ domain-containing protein [Clostridium chauvoei]